VTTEVTTLAERSKAYVGGQRVAGAVSQTVSVLRARAKAGLVVTAASALWAGGFAWLAIERHLAGGSHAEDLGFTDQVLSNFLRGHWFRMSVYQGATWNTEIDITRLARPDSLLAFHVEPMLLLLLPTYALGGTLALLALQAVAVAAGALPAYRLGRHFSGSSLGGLAVAGAYLLSPLGQWAVLADFHTSTLAAPLLLFAIERIVVARSPRQAVIAVALALTAREDVGPVVAALGLVVFARARRAGLLMGAMGVAWTVASLALVRVYSGGTSPFEVRYGSTLGAGLVPPLDALLRDQVREYAGTLALSGAWAAVFAPLALLPAVPSLALNVLSTSPWMAAGKAHYSGLVLPFVAASAAAGLRLFRPKRHLVHAASLLLMLGSLTGYRLGGAGPLAANYAPASVSDHARRAAALAASLPPDATVSATSAVVPRVSRRPSVYVFPAVLDASFVVLDLRASAAPTSPGDVFLRVRDLLAEGGWRVQSAQDGLLLLQRVPDAPAVPISTLSGVLADPEPHDSALDGRGASYGDVTLLSATLLPSPDGALDVDGPRWILRTTWRAERRLPPGTRLEFWIDRRDEPRQHIWDLADLWWDPPEAWTPGTEVTVDVPDVPVRQFQSWQATWSTP
jgi:uncharacterized membrane protein